MLVAHLVSAPCAVSLRRCSQRSAAGPSLTRSARQLQISRRLFEDALDLGAQRRLVVAVLVRKQRDAHNTVSASAGLAPRLYIPMTSLKITLERRLSATPSVTRSSGTR